MTRILRRFAAFLAALALVVVVAALLLLAWFDPNDHRETIVTALEEATGRAFTLDGRLELSWVPSPALVAGPVRLANDPAFPGDAFLAADEVAATLGLLPLLRGEVRFDQVRLAGVMLDLVVDRSGRGNWSSLQERIAAAGPPSDDAGGHPGERSVSRPKVTVEALRLTDGSVRFSHLGSGRRAALDDLSITLAPLRQEATTLVAIDGTYEVDGLAGTLSARLHARELLSADRLPVVTIERLSLANRRGMPLALAVDEAAVVDLDAGTVEVPAVAIRSGAATLRLAARGRGLPAAPRFTGELEIPPFSPAAWLRATDLPAASARDPLAMGRFEARAAFAYDGRVLELGQLRAQLDETTLTGRMTLGETIGFELAADAIDLDRYRPPASASVASKSRPSTFTLPATDGRIAVERLIVAGLEAGCVLLRVRTGDQGLRIEPIGGGATAAWGPSSPRIVGGQAGRAGQSRRPAYGLATQVGKWLSRW